VVCSVDNRTFSVLSHQCYRSPKGNVSSLLFLNRNAMDAEPSRCVDCQIVFEKLASSIFTPEAGHLPLNDAFDLPSTFHPVI